MTDCVSAPIEKERDRFICHPITMISPAESNQASRGLGPLHLAVSEVSRCPGESDLLRDAASTVPHGQPPLPPEIRVGGRVLGLRMRVNLLS